MWLRNLQRKQVMNVVRGAFLTIVTVLASALPAAAQGAPAAGPSLIGVWVWILVIGVIIFVAGTSIGFSSGKR
jgi:hypothetical protein